MTLIHPSTRSSPELRLGIAALEGFVGVAAVIGGISLMRTGSGMPTSWLSDTPFNSWVLPGLALIVVVGTSQLIAAGALVARTPGARTLSLGAGLVLVVWSCLQVVMLRRFHPFQPPMLAVGGLIAELSLRLPRREG